MKTRGGPRHNGGADEGSTSCRRCGPVLQQIQSNLRKLEVPPSLRSRRIGPGRKTSRRRGNSPDTGAVSLAIAGKCALSRRRAVTSAEALRKVHRRHQGRVHPGRDEATGRQRLPLLPARLRAGSACQCRCSGSRGRARINGGSSS